MSKSESETLSAQVRRAALASGLSMLELCRRAEIDKAALSRFFSGKVGLGTRALDRLGLALGLRVVVDAKVNAKGTGGKR